MAMVYMALYAEYEDEDGACWQDTIVHSQDEEDAWWNSLQPNHVHYHMARRCNSLAEAMVFLEIERIHSECLKYEPSLWQVDEMTGNVRFLRDMNFIVHPDELYDESVYLYRP